MRLSQSQKSIIHAAEYHAEETLASIARRCGSRPHIVRYHLNRLQQVGVLGQSRPFIDLNAAGYTSYTFYFSLASESRSDKEQILSKLQRNAKVLWILQIGGDFQYAMLVCARHVKEVIQLLGRVSVKFGSAFFDKSMSIRFGFTSFQRAYLNPGASQREVFSLSSMSEAVDLSAVEVQILSGLANEEYRSDKELSAKLSIPLSTFMRHKKKLEKKGVILGYYYRTHADSFGMQLFKLLIHAKGISAKLGRDLRHFAEGLDAATYFIECMGSWDFELGLEVSKASEVTEVTRELYDRFASDITSIRILPVFQFLKLTSFPA